MSYSLPYNPFLLLGDADTHSYSADNSQILWKGAGSDSAVTLHDDDTSVSDLEITINAAPLYVSVNGSLTKLKLSLDDECSNTLSDGLSESGDCFDSDYTDYYYYHETLAIVIRNEESDLPIALVNHKYSSNESDEFGDYFLIHDYNPYVVYFEATNDDNSNRVSVVKETRQESITESNNQYWEGVFQYDINNDGSTPTKFPANIHFIQSQTKT